MIKMKNLVLLFIVASFIITGNAVNMSQNNDKTGNTLQSMIAYDGPTIGQIETLKKVNDNVVPIIGIMEKKDKPLLDKINNTGAKDKFRVAIWTKADNITDIQKSDIDAVTTDQIDKNKKSRISKVSADIIAKQKNLIDFLRSKNLKILYEGRYAPVILTELTKSDIKEIETRDDVVSIQLETQYQETISSSASSVLAPPVWNYVKGGIIVAVVEDDGIAFTNPYLKSGLYFNQTNPNIKYHATGIAGIIASSNSTYRGIAYNGPSILSANSQTLNDSDLINATEWALDNGASVLSNSWVIDNEGNWTPITTYYDYIATHYPWPTIIFSAGNCGSCPYPHNIVGAPALGYNIITVGSYDDKRTGWQWSDDVMSYFSSYGSPPSPHNDRQKPEVVAVGNHSVTGYKGIISTTISYPWIGDIGAGTSFSAPQVAGEASLLMNESPSLMIWPEAVRAIIMASADHNIEGNSRLSNKDGVGGINILEAYKIANMGRGIGWDATALHYNSGTPWYGPNIIVNAGQKIRVVIAWDSNATGYGGSDSLDADLDLFIQRFDGSTWIDEPIAGYSNSGDNNYEILEFNSQASIAYRAKVIKYRWDNKNSTESIGYAAYIK
jgi:hypothetical protein